MLTGGTNPAASLAARSAASGAHSRFGSSSESVDIRQRSLIDRIVEIGLG